MAYIFNIGRRLFPRDATEDLPSRRTPFPFSPDATSSRLYLLRDFPWLVRRSVAAACLSQAFATLPQPTLSKLVRRAVWPTPPDNPSRNRQHASTRAPHAARSSPANPFLESPANSGTHAPNLQRLRQSGDARQDLVQNSESTTKCGDYGEESGGDAEVSKIRGESERALPQPLRFHPWMELSRAPRRLIVSLKAIVSRSQCNSARVGAVIISSRNHGDFQRF